jgi:hypothetical protein
MRAKTIDAVEEMLWAPVPDEIELLLRDNWAHKFSCQMRVIRHLRLEQREADTRP